MALSNTPCEKKIYVARAAIVARLGFSRMEHSSSCLVVAGNNVSISGFKWVVGTFWGS